MKADELHIYIDSFKRDIENDIENAKKIGIQWPLSELKKSIGIKYYLIFWRRKYYMQKEILKRVENEK